MANRWRTVRPYTLSRFLWGGGGAARKCACTHTIKLFKNIFTDRPVVMDLYIETHTARNLKLVLIFYCIFIVYYLLFFQFRFVSQNPVADAWLAPPPVGAHDRNCPLMYTMLLFTIRSGRIYIKLPWPCSTASDMKWCRLPVCFAQLRNTVLRVSFWALWSSL
jgi:hypothetical protein